MSKNKFPNRKPISFWGGILVFSLMFLAVSQQYLQAQDIALSITPPLVEVMIQPGREINQKYLISNNGQETPLRIKIVPFSPDGTSGNLKFEDILIYQDINLENWFRIDDQPLGENSRIFLPRGGNQEVNLTIAPGSDAPEGDYYLTLLFATDMGALVSGQGSTTQAQIGSHILITVSQDGNPHKEAKISKFTAPKLIDSFGKLSYNLQISNTGSAFFKPQGQIEVSSLFGSGQTLQLAPHNILAGSSREIPCLADEQLIRCNLNKKILLGIYNAKLKFSLDESDKTYEDQQLTLALPFSLLAAIAVIVILLRLILSSIKSKK